MLWPPQVDDLKADLGLARSDTRDDANLQMVLDAAVATVEEELYGDFNFSGAEVDEFGVLLPPVPPNVVMGTIRLARRWHERRRSPDGLIDTGGGEFGPIRIPRGDADIQWMLGVGNFRRPMV
jgi:uncharacterized protein YjiS (DUF1127 family)